MQHSPGTPESPRLEHAVSSSTSTSTSTTTTTSTTTSIKMMLSAPQLSCLPNAGCSNAVGLFVWCHAAGAVKKVDPLAINVMSGKSYEQEFDLEQERMKVSVGV
jgi:hypothetical protein